MRIVYFLIIMILMPSIIYAQCCPYIDSVEIIPTNPNDIEETSVILTVTTPNQGNFIYANSEIENTNVYITACYYSGILTALQTYVDTINLGVLPAGIYTYEFTAQQSESFDSCIMNDSQTHTGEFEVEIINSVLENEMSNLLIYPNPIQDNMLNLESVIGFQMLEIIDANGNVLIQNEYKHADSKVAINLTSLSTGIYMINVLFVDGERSTSKIVIE